MIKKLAVSSLILISSLFISCEYYSYGLDEFFYRNQTVENRTETLLELENSYKDQLPKDLPSKYKILLITDMHFGGENMGKNPDRWEKSFFKQMDKLWDESKDTDDFPKFCVALGDIAEHGLNKEFKNFKQKITDKLYEKYGIITFNVVGNHDLYNSGYTSYKKYCFPYTSFYRFETEKFSMYFLDSASCSLGNKQFTKLQRRFAYDDKPKLVFMHVPLYAESFFYFSMQNTTERNCLLSLFAKNKVKAVIDGHTHAENTTDFGKFSEYNLPGYLEDKSWAILTLDEEKEKITVNSHYLN